MIVLCCEMGLNGQYIARELARKQDLLALKAFSDRLDAAHERLVAAGRCACGRP